MIDIDKLTSQVMDDLDDFMDDPNEDKNQCQVCFKDLTEDSKIELKKCKHIFCYECLVSSYQNKNCNFTNPHSKRICPYCREPSESLALPKGDIPIKGIHSDYSYKLYYSNKNLVNDFQSKCVGIIKSGPNKGKQCNCKGKYLFEGKMYCGRHKIN